jgi:hypothetical protein
MKGFFLLLLGLAQRKTRLILCNPGPGGVHFGKAGARADLAAARRRAYNGEDQNAAKGGGWG